MKVPPSTSLLALCMGALLALVACDDTREATQVVVVVDSDLSVGDELTSVRVRVFDSDGEEEQSSQDFPLAPAAEKGKHTLPFRVRLARSSNEPGTFRLAVTGRGPLGPDGAEVDVAEQQAQVVFRPHVTSRLDMFLARICLQKLCRDGAELQTCDVSSGECGELPVKGDGAPPPDTAGDLDAEIPTSPRDAGRDGKIGNDRTQDATIGASDANVVEDAAADAAPTGCPSGQIMTSSGCITDPCTNSPCQHGGVCSAPNGLVHCTCDGTGYSGANCETDINECATAQCPADYPCVQTAPPGYTCRGQFADWPMPDYEPGAKFTPSYSWVADGSIRDNVTGLWWQERSLSNVGTPFSTYPSCNGAQLQGCTWDQARMYCEELTLGGMSDWRLPTLIELLSINDTRTFGKVGELFRQADEYLWSASHVGGSASAARIFWEWRIGSSSKDRRGNVKCVRGGSTVSAGPRYVIHEQSNELTDTRTTLVWQRSTTTVTADRAAGAAHCASLGGGRRLPTAKELMTLIDPARPPDGACAVDRRAFPNLMAGRYWSSSTALSYLPGSSGDLILQSDLTVPGEVTTYPEGQSFALCVR